MCQRLMRILKENEEQNKFTDFYYLIKIVNFTVFWKEKVKVTAYIKSRTREFENISATNLVELLMIE